MTHKEIEKIHKEICDSISSRHIKIAFDKLTILTNLLQIGEWSDKKMELETTYKYMLQYVIQGVADPEQTKIYNQLRISTMEVADRVKELLMMKDSPNYVYAQKRMLSQATFPNEGDILTELTTYNENLSMASIIEESMNKKDQIRDFSIDHEKMTTTIFNHFWLTDKYNTQETNLLKMIFASDEIQFADKSIIVSAVTISLIRTFDENKFDLLLEIHNDNDEQVRQRALVGFVLCAYWHNERIKLYDKLTQRIRLLVQQKEVSQNIQTIILQFIKSKETEKITKKIKEEFIPEMAKISPLIQDKIKLNDLMKDEKYLMDKNPDWQDILEKTGVTDKIQEFAELQMDGADVFMSTFSSMKTYPFFNDTCNWFMPFHNHSSVVNFFSENKKFTIFQTMMKSQFLCNSDKYSLAFSLMQMPQNYKEMMMQSVNMESEQSEEIKKEKELLSKTYQKEMISNQYIQDIYRFFKLHPRRNDFVDPFRSQLDFFRLFFFNGMAEHEAILRTIGETYFKQDNYEEAADIFELLLKTDTSSLELYQKTGYSYQRMGNYTKAISYYEYAETLKTDSLWNLRKIAFCYRSIKNQKKALNYYLRAEKLAPEDLGIQLAIGHCYLEQKKYSDALQVFFKIEYLTPNNPKVWRPIAWCSFVEGKFEQAEKYYQKINDKNQHDWLNMGHVALCLGNRTTATERYQKSLTGFSMNTCKFLEVFNEDIPVLVKNGINEDDIPILLDKVQYDITKD